MKRLTLVAACLVALAGCQTTDQQLDTEQQQAINTALQRVQFDMNCPTATGYTVGVEGCGQRQTIVVLCPQDGSGCFAGGERE